MTKRLITVAILILTSVLIFTSCGGVNYKDDVKVSDISAKITEKLSDGSNFAVSATYVEDNFNAPSVISDNCSEYVFYNHSSASVLDQFAIFHVKDSSKVSAVKDEVNVFMEAHVSELKSIVEKYDTSEAEKLDRVNIQVCGQYILYTLLGSDDAVTALGEFNRALINE